MPQIWALPEAEDVLRGAVALDRDNAPLVSSNVLQVCAARAHPRGKREQQRRDRRPDRRTAARSREAERANEWYANTTVVPVHGDVANLALLGTDDVKDLKTEGDFERFWVSYATARLERLGNLDHLGDDLRQLRQRVRELQAADPHPAFHRAASNARQVLADQDVLLLIDATERLFGDQHLRQGPSFRGLGNAWLRWRSAVPFVRFKCFVHSPNSNWRREPYGYEIPAISSSRSNCQKGAFERRLSVGFALARRADASDGFASRFGATVGAKLVAS